MTQIALITGANKGIGYQTARLLGAQEGMTVLVGARDETLGRQAEATLREGGADAHFVRLDVTDDKSIQLAAEKVEAAYGRLDILINNAGIIGGPGARGGPSTTTREAVREVFETNVFGPVVVINTFLPLLRRAEAARIVNVSSEVGSLSSISNPESPIYQLIGIPYPTSKTALNMVTVMYDKELRDTPIKVNAANPGYCATDLNGKSGFRTPTQGAEISVHLATLPADGPSGQLWGSLWVDGDSDANGAIAW